VRLIKCEQKKNLSRRQLCRGKDMYNKMSSLKEEYN
jgi:hypothetical protein